MTITLCKGRFLLQVIRQLESTINRTPQSIGLLLQFGKQCLWLQRLLFNPIRNKDLQKLFVLAYWTRIGILEEV